MTAPAKPNRLREDELCGNKRLHVHIPDSRPSWKRHGEGVANVEFTFYSRARDGAGCIGIAAEETAFANKAAGDRRDTSKSVMLEIDRNACIALHRMTGKMLGIPDGEER